MTLGARPVAAALLVLLVVQGASVAALRGGSGVAPARARCGTPVPAVDRTLPLDADLRLRGELSVGGHGGGIAVLVNRGRRPVVVLTTQAVLLAPAERAAVSPPEPPRRTGRLLRPGQFLRQPWAVSGRACLGGALPPGFYEVALVVVLQRVGAGRVVATVTSRSAVVARPRAGG